jgi:hypothetical protein
MQGKRFMCRSSAVLLAVFVAVASGCGSSGSSDGGTTPGGGSGGVGANTAATPTFSPAAGTYATAQQVTIASTTPGAVIHYTTDGSTPTATSATYSTPVSVSASLTLKAIATASGFSDSAVGTAAYVINTGGGTTLAATPTFSPAAGAYTSAQSVTISSTTPAAVIHYTTDGSTPTATSATYSTPVSVATSLTLKAIATATGFTNSAVGSAAYVINTGGGTTPAATPTFSPAAGTYTSAQSVTIASTTPAAIIRYTTDGSTPTTSSTIYTTPVIVSTSLTLRALATATGFTTSAVGSAAYVISTGGGGGGPSSAAMCQAMSDRYATLTASCYHWNPDFVATYAPSSADSCSETEKAIAAHRATYNASAAATCQSALAGVTCNDLATGNFPAACQQAVQGTVANGGACYSGVDCANGTCSSSALVCPGTCQAYLTVGQSCGSSGTCAADLICSAGVCVAVSTTVGGACPCEGNLWCDPSTGGAGTCKAKLANGTTCNGSLDQCLLGSICVGTPSTCQSQVGLGGDCTASDSLCGMGYQCSATTHSCVSAPTLGQACDTMPICVGGYCDLFSVTPTCIALKANGQSCGYSFECASQLCGSGGTCVVATCPEP